MAQSTEQQALIDKLSELGAAIREKNIAREKQEVAGYGNEPKLRFGKLVKDLGLTEQKATEILGMYDKFSKPAKTAVNYAVATDVNSTAHLFAHTDIQRNECKEAKTIALQTVAHLDNPEFLKYSRAVAILELSGAATDFSLQNLQKSALRGSAPAGYETLSSKSFSTEGYTANIPVCRNKVAQQTKDKAAGL